MNIISVCNQKGGVGKTTTAVNLSEGISLCNKKTLLIDLDPQTNASSYLGFRKTDPLRCSYTVLEKPGSIRNSILKKSQYLDLIPSSLSYLEDTGPKEGSDPLFRLIQALEFIDKEYDFVVIDCPPSLGPYTYNAIYASDLAIIPVQSHYLSLEGLSQIVGLMQDLKEVKAISFKILLTMFEADKDLSLEVRNEIIQHFPNERMSVEIPYDIVLAEAPSHEKSIFDYAALSPSALAYSIIVKEILNEFR